MGIDEVMDFCWCVICRCLVPLYIDTVEHIRVNGIVCVYVSRPLIWNRLITSPKCLINSMWPGYFFLLVSYEIQPSDRAVTMGMCIKNETHCVVWLSNEQVMFIITKSYADCVVSRCWCLGTNQVTRKRCVTFQNEFTNWNKIRSWIISFLTWSQICQNIQTFY